MSAKIISIMNQKGGAGKTTVTMQLAGTLGKRGHKVAVIDGDPQESSIYWASLSPEDLQFPASVFGMHGHGTGMSLAIKKIVDDYEYIIIDNPPSVNSIIPRQSLLISDLVIVPVLPTNIDFMATMKARDLIEEMQTINTSLVSRILLNQVQPTSLNKAIIENLQDLQIKPFATQFGSRVAYKESGMGFTVHDLPNAEKAREEVNEFVDEVLKLIN